MYLECSVEQPNIKHPDCQKFYHCEKLLNGTIKLYEKTCGPETLFNPFNMICDYPQNVIQLRPECESMFGYKLHEYSLYN